MELPTYTSIWRIEKRLYKLYDFRLPMPLPVGQIAVFLAITVPYVILLTLLGLPFSHTLFWLYVLPPAVLTWLATRPVLESKRLPELAMSQARYLGEPPVWCRMAPPAEKDDIIVTGRVWRRVHRQLALVPPGRPDRDRRDRARAVLPVDGPRLVAVLGCTVGAGQTVTTLIVADVLASLRGQAVAALDLNPGPASLGELAAPRVPIPVSTLLAAPAAGQAGDPRHAIFGNRPASGQQRGPGRLDVVTTEVPGDGSLALSDLECRRLFGTVMARYPLGLVDPGTAAVARVLAAADQLVLVAPASPDAARSLAMTTEWLAAHGYGALTANSITVLNGLSKRSMPHAEQAERVVRGRCRAIVRVPWDDHLAGPQAGQGSADSSGQGGEPSRLRQLRPPVLRAYTALAGVLVASLAGRPQRGDGR